MSRVSTMMTVGKQAMMNSQTALHTVGHNIANKETEGYSRQRVETHTNFPTGLGKLRIGTGARAATVQRINNPYLEKQIGTEMAKLAYYKGQGDGLSRVEQVYNEQLTDGLNNSMGEFFNAFRELSTNPESSAKRMLVKQTADSMTQDFARVSTQLEDISKDIDTQIEVNVQEINSYTDEIASLNERIQFVEIQGGYANDERDRRDLLLKKLGEKIDINFAEGKDSNVTVQAAGNAILVHGSSANRLDVVHTPGRDGKSAGSVDVWYYHHEYAQPVQITDHIKGGALGGLISVRSGELKELKNNIDLMAYTVGSETNRLHAQGYNTYNQTGINFFEPMDSLEDASNLLKVSSPIVADINLISAALDPARPGDNRICNEIADLQYKKLLFDGTTSLDSFYNGMVGEMGVKTHGVNNRVEVQEGILKQLNGLRESISGVSLDEEAAKMIEWQKQFDASARLIRTADEVLETVINLKKY